VVDISNVFVPSRPANIYFTITPLLPINTGLQFSNSTGSITGTTTFTSTTPFQTYTVDASFNGTHKTAILQLSINFIPGFFYPYTPYLLEKDVSTNEIIPIYYISNLVGITYTLISSPPLSDISLNLNPTDGSISGTPKTISAYKTYTIRANNNGIIYDTSLNIGVQTLPFIIYPNQPYILTQGVQTRILPSSGLQPGTTYSIGDCPLPNNLSLNPNTGEISGIPLLPTTFREYIIKGSNAIGVSYTKIAINIIKEVLAPVVTGENANVMISAPEFAMRRKAEILKYKKNSADLSKSQYYALLAKGNGPYAKRAWGNQGDRGTNPNTSGLPLSGNTILCNSDSNIICSPTSSSDVPGPVMNLCYNPATPLVGYVQPNRKKTNIGFKWPQRGWTIGDMGFPRGKAGAILD